LSSSSSCAPKPKRTRYALPQAIYNKDKAPHCPGQVTTAALQRTQAQLTEVTGKSDQATQHAARLQAELVALETRQASELETKNKLVTLYKASHEDSRAKADEFASALAGIQALLHSEQEKHATNMAQAQDHVVALENSVRELEAQLSAQEKELFHANQLLQQKPSVASAGGWPFFLTCVMLKNSFVYFFCFRWGYAVGLVIEKDAELSAFSPSARIASTLLKVCTCVVDRSRGLFLTEKPPFHTIGGHEPDANVQPACCDFRRTSARKERIETAGFVPAPNHLGD
jgi:hypothetical protein